MSPNCRSNSFHDPITIDTHHRTTAESSELVIPMSLSSCEIQQLRNPSIPEPTPIAVHRIEVVDKVRLQDNTDFFQQQMIRNFLPLFQRGGMADIVPFDDLSELRMAPPESRFNSPIHCEDTDPYKSHSEKWNQHYRDLVDFKGEFGHCLVPLDWPLNPPLAHWIKHQRCQFKAKVEGRHSTLTEERKEALENIGFVWDAHRATWEVRFCELSAFQETNGHCNVPSKFQVNPKLFTWMKCQRRQYKLYVQGRKSHMTSERVEKLSSIGFVWFPRNRPKKSTPSPVMSFDKDLFAL